MSRKNSNSAHRGGISAVRFRGELVVGGACRTCSHAFTWHDRGTPESGGQCWSPAHDCFGRELDHGCTCVEFKPATYHG